MNTQFNSNVIWLQLEYKISTLNKVLIFWEGHRRNLKKILKQQSRVHNIKKKNRQEIYQL